MADDPLISDAEREEAEHGAADETRAANLFDLRRIIGGLLSVYGIVLIIVGLTDSQAKISKAAGVHINLWSGIGMLILGLIFIAWALARPLGQQLQESSEEPRGGSGGDGEGAVRAADARS